MTESEQVFAEMLGMGGKPRVKNAPVRREPTPATAAEPVQSTPREPDELTVQREVVKELAEESVSLRAENGELKAENVRLRNEIEELGLARLDALADVAAHAAALAYCGDSLRQRTESLAAMRSENDALEEKLARMGRSLAQARRQAAGK